MRRILAHRAPLTTRNRGEAHDHAKPGTIACDAYAVEQIDLLGTVALLKPSPFGQLTGLIARLILEHAQISSPALRTEAGHDH